jgi:hypothetical protein
MPSKGLRYLGLPANLFGYFEPINMQQAARMLARRRPGLGRKSCQEGKSPELAASA